MDEILPWFVTNGGKLNSSIRLAKDDKFGLHFVAGHDIAENTIASVCPLDLTISYLNCLVDPPAGIRPADPSSISRKLVGKMDANVVAAFFLVEERLKGEDSFWAPYITLLPKEDELETPLWFLQNDIDWLKGTNLYLLNGSESNTAVEQRKSNFKSAWEEGVKYLGAQGINTDKFTLSFTSKIMMQSSENQFSLLYPVIDYFNHRFGHKVHWNMEMGNFSLLLAQATAEGDQVFNNYAPKGNEELLMGYGFCIKDNPCDEFVLRLGKPSSSVHAALRSCLPNHYISEVWNNNESLFRLRGSGHYTKGYGKPFGLTCLRGVPPELLVSIQVRLSFSMGVQDEVYKKDLEVWFASLDMILHQLQQKKLGIIQWDPSLPTEPENERQAHAQCYRNGQLKILEEIILELETFLQPIENESSSLEQVFAQLQLE